MTSLQPYQLTVLLSQYTKRHCQLCHYYPSVYIDNSSLHAGTVDRKLNSQFNTGILCQRCHDSVYWLPKPLKVILSQKIKKQVRPPNAFTSKSLDTLQTNTSQTNTPQTNTPQTNTPQTNTSQISISQISTSQNQLIIQPITYYQAPMKKVIQNFKFKENLCMLPVLWHAICQLPIPNGCHSDNSVILPMPTTDSRIVERGFDPLSVITPYLSKHWKIPIWKGVARVDDTISQRGLSRTERQKNIKGAFVVTEPIAVSNIILFDDIATTGSSLQELAITLLSVDKTLQLTAYCLAHGNAMN